MGIINATPDSFSGDGRRPHQAILEAVQFIKEGADILDIGGESTRPGAQPVTAREEIKRVIPVISGIIKKNPSVPISVDTYKPLVARAALDAGAIIVNNIMGTTPNKELLKIIRNYNAGVVLMHIQGRPRAMQRQPRYRHIIEEIIRSLRLSIENCLEIGIKSDRIIIDPGIGFGKTVEHNLKILNHLDRFQILRKPILVGTSRKSFIGKILNKDVADRLMGTMATVAASLLKGANVVRVHDVTAAKEVSTVIDAIKNEKIHT